MSQREQEWLNKIATSADRHAAEFNRVHGELRNTLLRSEAWRLWLDGRYHRAADLLLAELYTELARLEVSGNPIDNEHDWARMALNSAAVHQATRDKT